MRIGLTYLWRLSYIGGGFSFLWFDWREIEYKTKSNQIPNRALADCLEELHLRLCCEWRQNSQATIAYYPSMFPYRHKRREKLVVDVVVARFNPYWCLAPNSAHWEKIKPFEIKHLLVVVTLGNVRSFHMERLIFQLTVLMLILIDLTHFAHVKTFSLQLFDILIARFEAKEPNFKSPSRDPLNCGCVYLHKRLSEPFHDRYFLLYSGCTPFSPLALISSLVFIHASSKPLRYHVASL